MGCASSSAVVAGGFTVGDRVFYGGAARRKKDPGVPALSFGEEGEVVGQTCGGKLVVNFSDAGRVSVRAVELSRKPPTIPGGFSLGECVFYGGPARKYPNGDHVSFGAQGEVAGRSCIGDGMDGERLSVLFPQHREAKAVRIALVSRVPPVIPGGYAVGDHVYWCGMNWTFPNGDRLKFGAEGEVAGRSCVGDGMDDERVAVNFPGNKGAVAMRLPEISQELPVIPGGYCIGDRVFYAYPNWRAPDGHMLLFGVQGKVIGRSCIGDGKDDERVWALFPGLGYGCICLEQIAREPPVIPGGYNLSDKVYYGGPSRPAGINGDRLTFGVVGEVAGKATSSRPSHRTDIAVRFPGNEDATDVRLAEISREPPVIPGGFEVGEKIFYCGQDWNFANGDRLTYGARGEVRGRSCQGDGLDEERVAVILPGNRAAAQLGLAETSREPPSRLAEILASRLEAALEGRFWEDEVARPAGSQTVMSPEGEARQPVHRVPDVAELAICYRTAIGAGISAVAEAAQEACFAQVVKGHEARDMALLSELRRAAEDAEWQELRKRATDALEEVAVPQVLSNAQAADDYFAMIAIERRCRTKGWSPLVERAATSIAAIEAIEPGLLEVRSRLQKVSLDEEESPSSLYQRSHGKADPDADQRLVDQMQLLLDETYTGWGGFGKRTRTRDRPNERVAERLEVERVVQLRNLDSYLSYLVRRQVVGAELPDGCRRDWNVRTDSGDLSPIASRGADTTGSVRSFLSGVDSDLNEHYLWHGTGPAEAEGIADRGFDIEQAGSSRGALFGRGLYFAESCLKADEYVRPDENGHFPLILCRVTLGNVNYCDAEDPWELRESLRVSCRAGLGGHHSVLGDREKVRQTFREFVVFDGHQAYPEYIVWYSRK